MSITTQNDMPNSRIESTTAARQGRALSGKPGTRRNSTRAKLSTITARNTASASGVRMSCAQ
ncbi:hypothetical protein ACRAWD_25840 [Caulobacter segnis]